MRPIDKGPCPQADGVDKTVSNCRDWRSDLIQRIGYYCAYCNMALSHQLHVEHVVPKNPLPGQPAGELLAWDNMLLACEKCNNAKSNKLLDETIHYLPEYHNGLLPFVAAISPNNPAALIIEAKPGLPPAQREKAQKTIADLEWQNVDTRGTVTDIRWLRRYDAQKEVKAARMLLEMAKDSPSYDADTAGKLVAIMASSTGFFLLWFQEFSDEPLVLKWLINPDLYSGVSQGCFDMVTYAPIPRNPDHPDDSI